MTVIDCVEISLSEKITFGSAKGLIAKIQAAMKNGITHIHLQCSPDTEISSAQFLAFLAMASRHIKDSGGELTIVNANSKVRDLLSISRLDHLAA